MTSRSMNSTAVGSAPQASTWGTARTQASRSSNGASTETFARGMGSSFKISLVTMPSVPSEPTSSESRL